MDQRSNTLALRTEKLRGWVLLIFCILWLKEVLRCYFGAKVREAENKDEKHHEEDQFDRRHIDTIK
jgi:hypothetical protein